MTNKILHFYEWFSAILLVAFVVMILKWTQALLELERTQEELEYYKIHSTLNTTKEIQS